MGVFKDIEKKLNDNAKSGVSIPGDLKAPSFSPGGAPTLNYGKLEQNPQQYEDYIKSRSNEGTGDQFQQYIPGIMTKDQLAQAADLKNPYGEFQTEKFGQLRNDQLRDLASTNQTDRQMMNKHGLYGAGVEGVQQKNAATTSKNIAMGKGLIRSAAEEKAKQIENDVLNHALEQRQTQQTMYDTIYSSALNDYQSKRQALKSVGQGVGAVVGGVVGAAAGGVGTGAGAAGGAYVGGALAE